MTIEIKTWTDGYLALRQLMFELRGKDELETGARWPRTTGDDVLFIAALFDYPLRVCATPGLAARWRMVLGDIERLALIGADTDYPENQMFWSVTAAAAVFLDDAGVEVPSSLTWEATLDVLRGAYRNVGPKSDGPFKHFDGVHTFDDLYIAQLKYLRELRGEDVMEPPAGVSGGTRPIPRTTNADVIALADYWSKQLADAKHVMGHDGVVKLWKAATADVDQIARKGDRAAVYAKNNAFWRALSTTAIQVAIADEAPTSLGLAKSAIKDSALHLPETLEEAASKGADLVASAAHALGKVANEAGKGLFQGFGTPLLIGAGLLGVFLLSRGKKED